MKTKRQFIRMFSDTALRLVFAAGLTIAAQASDQYKPAGHDGITASPRVRQQLDERRARAVTAAVALPAMACPKCEDKWISEPNKEPRGAGGRTLMGNTTNRVAHHSCDGCRIDWTIQGTGKTRHQVAAHKCTASGSESLACCATR